MCGHVSAAVASERCPCVVGCSGDVVFPPPPQEQFPPLQLLLNYHELMIDTSTAEFDLTGESAKFYCFSGGSVSGCDSPSSLGSGGEGKQSAARHTSVNSNDGYLSNFISAHGPTFDSGPIRRAHSAGDVHRVNKKGQQQQGRRGESELWSESNAIIQGMNRTAKYSPEEKKERIERYRSKRNLRNFNKRIKYECRKTLAEGRARVRGRFARNCDETGDKIVDVFVQDSDTSSAAWASFLDSFLS